MTEDTRQRAAGEIMGRSQKVDIAVNVSFSVTGLRFLTSVF